jgi:hypothetical protein
MDFSSERNITKFIKLWSGRTSVLACRSNLADVKCAIYRKSLVLHGFWSGVSLNFTSFRVKVDSKKLDYKLSRFLKSNIIFFYLRTLRWRGLSQSPKFRDDSIVINSTSECKLWSLILSRSASCLSLHSLLSIRHWEYVPFIIGLYSPLTTLP